MGRGETENEIPISRRRTPPPWMELDEGVTENILRRLGAEDILRCAEKVCTTWRRLCLDPAMWRVVHLRNRRKNDWDRNLAFDIMCCRAVDRSQGQLIDLSITGFGGDGLLTYVADRSSHLRRLTLADTSVKSESTLTAAVRKLPWLEELHLIEWITPLDAEDVATIGISCPLLNSFTYDEIPTTYSPDRFVEFEEDDSYEFGIASAIAKTMPNLHQLRLVGFEMKDEGLEAILDGCPRLESLDLLDCYGLDLRGALIGRCLKQIKSLRLPVEDDFDPR